MDDNGCTKDMNDRGITDGNGCKPTNTFIKANFTSVRHVCGTGGKNIGGNNYKSKKKFNIIVCTRPKGNPPDCKYKSARYNKYIVVACIKRNPVHFVRFLPDESE
uniref:Ribonuclease A-domain domain-containing protein n=1 Tax=Sander lucioperca TaxID=283035 RepID=A0A8D0D9D0_SANLU